MKIVLHCLFCSLLLPAATCLAESPEVTASRTAAEKHNETISDASQRLEKAIAAAHREHAKQIISAKERMVVDLRRAYRTALRGDTPENAGTIERQIKRLEAQIEELKSETATRPEVKLKGLDPRLVGIVIAATYRGNLGRVYRIESDGQVTVLFDQFADQPGSDVGQQYQGVIRDGKLLVHFSKHTRDDASKGRVLSLEINREEQVVFYGTHYTHHNKRGFVEEDAWRRNYKEVYFDNISDLPKGYHDELGVKPKEPKEVGDDDVDPDFVEEDEVQEDLDEEVDFFGIPIK